MRGERWRPAAEDLIGGGRRHWLWGALGRNDIRQRYSGSMLGSLWLTVNIALLVLCLTLIFAKPLGAHRDHYASYVTIGLVLWYFVQATLNEATGMFVTAADTIRHSTIPLSTQVFRVVWRNVIVLGHTAVIVPVALIALGFVPGAGALLSLAGLLLLILALLPVSLLLGLLGARYRDVNQIVTSLLQLLFFATPIFWYPAAAGPDGERIAAVNPIFAFIDIVRSPLLGETPAPASWPIAAAVTLLSLVTAGIAFARFRSRIGYWV